jgi:hypothetical protein
VIHPPSASKIFSSIRSGRPRLALTFAATSLLLSGCAVVAVVDVAASAVVGVAGLAVDAAVGTARIGGKIIGAGADAMLGNDDEKEDE